MGINQFMVDWLWLSLPPPPTLKIVPTPLNRTVHLQYCMSKLLLDYYHLLSSRLYSKISYHNLLSINTVEPGLIRTLENKDTYII